MSSSRPHQCSARAPRLASLSTNRGTPCFSPSSSRPRRCSQAGRTTLERRSGWAGSRGQGTATPMPTSARPAASGVARQASQSSAMSARVPGGVGADRVLPGLARPAPGRAGRSGRRPRGRAPISTPRMVQASSWNSRTMGRRPPREGPSPTSATRPMGSSSPTISDTVERERPARRAISAREMRCSCQIRRSTASARGRGRSGSVRRTPFQIMSPVRASAESSCWFHPRRVVPTGASTCCRSAPAGHRTCSARSRQYSPNPRPRAGRNSRAGCPGTTSRRC